MTFENLTLGVGKYSGEKEKPYQNDELLREAILNAMRAFGLGKVDYENPLRDLIQNGMSVLLKPNWVMHYNQSDGGMDCMITHPNFVLVVLKLVLDCDPSRVILGDAPIQGCKLDEIVTPEYRNRIHSLPGGDKVEVIDFRRTILTSGNLREGVQTGVRSLADYILFDLQKDSLLEPISRPKGRFRVTMYDPRKLAATHAPGRHQYLLCREPFVVDLVVNLPKLKTHRKAGITGALKNLVGLNGNKDYLPHHRRGGSRIGGDCYPGFTIYKELAEFFLDRANRHIGTPKYSTWVKGYYKALGWQSKHYGDMELEGSWYGNDTVWRTVLDLNRILLYGKADGTLADTSQRKILSITDAIVAGQMEGPLHPQPYWMGLVTCSLSSVAADWIHALLMGMDPRKIPLIRHSIDAFRWPLHCGEPEFVACEEDSKISWESVRDVYHGQVVPPQGWMEHCELEAR